MSEALKWKVSKPTALLYDLKPISLSCHERVLWSASASFHQSLLTAQQLFLCFALQNQTDFLTKTKEGEGRIFLPKFILFLEFYIRGGWFTVSCFLAMGSSTWLLSPPRVIQNSCHASQSLYELIIPHLLKGELPATRILIEVTQASWITAWGLLSRLWRRCCFLGFSITLPHSTRLSRLKGVFNFPDIQGHYSCPRHEIWKKEEERLQTPPSPNKLKPQSCVVQDVFWNAVCRMRFW